MTSDTCYLERSKVREIIIDSEDQDILSNIDRLAIFTATDFLEYQDLIAKIEPDAKMIAARDAKIVELEAGYEIMMRDCDSAQAKNAADAKVIAGLREALRRAAEALNAAVKDISNGPYTLSARQSRLQDNLRAAVGDALLAANAQTVGENK